MTLEDYFRREVEAGKIDFSLRASVHQGVVIYIHPTNRDGDTTPMLVVSGNTVSVAFDSSHPDWPVATATARQGRC